MYTEPTIHSFTMNDIREQIAAGASGCSGGYSVNCTGLYTDVQIPLPSL